MVSGGARAVARCDELGIAPFSDSADGLYRGFLSPSYVAAQAMVARWMGEAGMTVRIDGAGNLIGRYEGIKDGPVVLIGSHLDSVRDAGRYDGPLGIMLGIEAVAALHGSSKRLAFPIEVVAFGDEEGSRFPAAMLTSRAVAGTLDPAMLDIADGGGESLAAALATYEGKKAAILGSGTVARADHDWRSAFAAARRATNSIRAYLEAHIEQGPVLEAEGLAVGAVTAIAAQRRYGLMVRGRAGHAGTNAMSLRHDALAGAAEMVLAAESIAKQGPAGLVATVGKLEVLPGAANVVPGRAAFTLDVRAGSDELRDRAAAAIMARFVEIAKARGLVLDTQLLQNLPASPCDPVLVDRLEAAMQAQAQPPRRLVSGAGHDAMIMAALCPTAMLFIRCKGGVSHNPAEEIAPQDADIALKVMLTFLENFSDD
jgi:allantoate deiminase